MAPPQLPSWLPGQIASMELPAGLSADKMQPRPARRRGLPAGSRESGFCCRGKKQLRRSSAGRVFMVDRRKKLFASIDPIIAYQLFSEPPTNQNDVE